MSILNGFHLPNLKNTALLSAVTMPPPKTVTIPMNMHIGAPSKPIVKIGDEVKVGTLIAEAGGFVSSPVHASVSGKIKNIGSMLASNGSSAVTVTIESDGQMTPDESIAPPDVHDYDSFISAVRESGVIGLGGAGFPTAVKLGVDISRIEVIVLNGAECEPYITSDTRTMLDKSDLIKDGIELLKKYLGAKNIIIAIENNKPEAIKEMKKLTDDTVKVKVLPHLYPQGGEKVLIYNTTGKVIPEGKLPIDVGCIVLNITTLAFIAEYLKTGMPLVRKTITVDGSAVKNPQNVIVPIGTAMSDVYEFCGGFTEQPAKMLYGGPMMGISVKYPDAPILKNTNAIVAMNEEEAHLPEPTACIRCGRCVRVCPLNLMPLDFARAYALRDYELLEKRKINICMECGCCSFVCPAHRPLVENHKLAKAALKKHKEVTKGAEK